MTTLAVSELIERWRPGSQDTADGPEGANYAWTWAHEVADLLTRDRGRTEPIIWLAIHEGIDFAAEHVPVTLGDDGRVWDGHHRIVAAIALGIDKMTVDDVARDRRSKP